MEFGKPAELNSASSSQHESRMLNMLFNSLIEPTWEDILYGFREGFLEIKDVNEFAFLQIEAGDERQDILNLAWPDIDSIEAEKYMCRIGASFDESSVDLCRKRWQYSFVIDAIVRADSCKDLLMRTDSICTRFEYPSELMSMALDTYFITADSFFVDLSYIVDEDYTGTRLLEQSKSYFSKAIKEYLVCAQTELRLEPKDLSSVIDRLCE